MTDQPAPSPVQSAGVPPRSRVPSTRSPMGVLLAILLSVVMFATAVAQTESTGPEASAGAGASLPASGSAGPALEGTEWLLDVGASAALAGVAPSAVAGSPGPSPIPSVPLVTLLLGPVLATGSDGCNDYSAPYVLAGSAISFGDVAVSYPPRTCAPARSAIEFRVCRRARFRHEIPPVGLHAGPHGSRRHASAHLPGEHPADRRGRLGGDGPARRHRDARDAHRRRCPDAGLWCQRVTGWHDGLQPGVRPLCRRRRCNGDGSAGRDACRLRDRGAVVPGGAIRGCPGGREGMVGRGQRAEPARWAGYALDDPGARPERGAAAQPDPDAIGEPVSGPDCEADTWYGRGARCRGRCRS